MKHLPLVGAASTPNIITTHQASPTRRQRLQRLLEVLLCTDLLAALALQGIFFALGYKTELILRSSQLLAAFVLCNSMVVLATIAVVLKFRRESWKTLVGSYFLWRREALIGLAFVPVLFVGTTAVGLFFRKFFPSLVTQENPLLLMIKTPKDVFWFLLMVSFSGGVKEEIQRAFILRRFEKYLGGIYLGLVIFTLYFGSAHYLQGWDNAVGAGVLGLLFGLAYIWRQNLFVPLVAHTVYDWIVILLYWLFGLK